MFACPPSYALCKTACSLNNIVISITKSRLCNESLPCPSGSVRVFEALDSDPALVKTIDAHSPVGRTIQLKVGAQVCLFILHNLLQFGIQHCTVDELSLNEDRSFILILVMFFFKVMLTKNLDVARGLVNGARGVVVAFDSGKHGQYFIYYLS